MTAATRAQLTIDGRRGVVFDLDGVLTNTATLHRIAWQEVFDAEFEQLSKTSGLKVAGLTDDDYRRLVDGRLRIDGARAVLEDRQVDSGDDQARERRATQLAARKDARYRALLSERGPSAYESSLKFLRELRAAGIGIAVATASRNAVEVLSLAGLLDELDALVDGRSASASGLRGKPAPDTFLEAAARLGFSARECLAFDDGPSGVAAGKAGGFFMIGVDRTGNRRDLLAHGADLVVSDLGEIEISGGGPRRDPTLVFDSDNDDDEEGVRESLFTLGNGYIATRGARFWTREDEQHYPGTYFAGIFDRLSARPESAHEVDEDALVNAPNWLRTCVSMADGAFLGDPGVKVEHKGAQLDLGAGVLLRRFRLIDQVGHACSVLERRFVSMDDPHLAAIEINIVAENWSGRLSLHSELDAKVVADETIEERLLGGSHLALVSSEASESLASLAVRTVTSEISLVEAARVRLLGAVAASHGVQESTSPAVDLSCEIAEGQRITCEKVVAFYSSKDAAVSSPSSAARAALSRAPNFEELLARHRFAWHYLWDRSRVVVRDETETVQRLVNFQLFHLLQVASPHVVGRDIGLGARGLHGEGYLGHVFWDELFILPVVARRFPAVARSLLDYRWRRLGSARQLARAEGHAGAMFPWQSASDGRDETPHWLYNPRSQRWMQDRSRYQRHVGLAIAYNFWQYYETTGDLQYLFDVGAETMLEVAKFFSSLARFDQSLGRYRIAGVMGPDEFHDGYPWRSEAGIDDNAYTNMMTAWLFGRCLQVAQLLRDSGRLEQLERLQIDDVALARFDDISRRLYVPFMGGVLAQFEGYDQLEPFDIDAYRARYGDLSRLDLILEAEGDSVRRYQVGKQPDALMPLFLFSAEELRGVLGQLGYGFDAEMIRNTIDFYSARVTHGSSLSRVVHAWINARRDRTSSWRYLFEALRADVTDLNKGTTREGIHLGSMAGTVDIFERCYSGLEMRSDVLWLNPTLPDQAQSIGFRVEYRGHLLEFEIDHQQVVISSPARPAAAVTVLIAGEPLIVESGCRISYKLRRRSAGGPTHDGST